MGHQPQSQAVGYTFSQPTNAPNKEHSFYPYVPNSYK